MFTLEIADGTVSVDYDGLEADEYPGGYRRRYRYVITANGWRYVGNDLASGVGADVDERDMMASLLGFMFACAESRGYRTPAGEPGENASLFPDHVGEWLESVSDELSLAELELDSDGWE